MTKVDVTKHILASKHQKISEKEKKELIEKYHISLKELPKILKTDAMIQNLKIDSGDVIKIIRKSPTGGEAVYYRVVISG